MTTNEYLAQLGKLRIKIEKMQERIEEYRALAQSPATANYSGIKVQSSPSGEAPFVKWTFKIIELEKKVAELKDELQTVQATVITAIEQLENEDYKTVLVLRYLQGLDWETIAAKMCTHKRTAQRWHNEALEKLSLNVA